MSGLLAVLRWTYIAAGVLSVYGFWRAKTVVKSSGPTKPIADFSAFMAYSFGAHLFACFALAAAAVLSRDRSAVVYGILLAAPFLIAFRAKEYEQANSAFNAQIAAIAGGLLWSIVREF